MGKFIIRNATVRAVPVPAANPIRLLSPQGAMGFPGMLGQKVRL